MLFVANIDLRQKALADKYNLRNVNTKRYPKQAFADMHHGVLELVRCLSAESKSMYINRLENTTSEYSRSMYGKWPNSKQSRTSFILDRSLSNVIQFLSDNRSVLTGTA